jgi:hypothetical protein
MSGSNTTLSVEKAPSILDANVKHAVSSATKSSQGEEEYPSGFHLVMIVVALMLSMFLVSFTQ